MRNECASRIVDEKIIMEPEEKLKLYLNKLANEVTLLSSSYKLLIYLNESLSKYKNEMMEAPGFFNLVIISLGNYIIITLAKIFENPNRSDLNLYKFLNFIEQNSKKINFKKGKNYSLVENRRLIDENSNKIDTILKWRDKSFAHYDKKFLQEGILPKEFPLTKDDLKTLIDISKKIVNMYCDLFEVENIAVEYSNCDDIENIFYILKKIKEK